MNYYLFLKLSQKVKECNSKQITDSDFEYDDLTEGFTSAWFEIHKLPYEENYNVKIEGDKVYLAQGDSNICRITGQNAENWLQLAKDLFQSKYEDEIERVLYGDYNYQCQDTGAWEIDYRAYHRDQARIHQADFSGNR